MKTIETSITLDDLYNLSFEQIDEVVANAKKLANRPSTVEDANYRNVGAYNPGWEFPDGTKHILYDVTYKADKKDKHSMALKRDTYKHQEVSEM